MKVLLLEDVENIGHAGSVVNVADGYARNLLLPRRLAKGVTEGSVKEVEQVRRAAERKRTRQLSASQDLARQIEGVTLTFQARAGDTGKLYGSITTADIATALEQRTGIQVDRRKIVADPLRQLGECQVEVHLIADVVAHVKVIVEAEESAPSQTEA